MKKIFLLMGIMTLLLAGGCDENKDVLIADVDDITLNELSLDMFTHKIPEGGFQSGIVRFNTMTEPMAALHTLTGVTVPLPGAVHNRLWTLIFIACLLLNPIIQRSMQSLVLKMKRLF